MDPDSLSSPTKSPALDHAGLDPTPGEGRLPSWRKPVPMPSKRIDPSSRVKPVPEALSTDLSFLLPRTPPWSPITETLGDEVTALPRPSPASPKRPLDTATSLKRVLMWPASKTSHQHSQSDGGSQRRVLGSPFKANMTHFSFTSSESNDGSDDARSLAKTAPRLRWVEKSAISGPVETERRFAGGSFLETRCSSAQSHPMERTKARRPSSSPAMTANSNGHHHCQTFYSPNSPLKFSQTNPTSIVSPGSLNTPPQTPTSSTGRRTPTPVQSHHRPTTPNDYHIDLGSGWYDSDSDSETQGEGRGARLKQLLKERVSLAHIRNRLSGESDSAEGGLRRPTKIVAEEPAAGSRRKGFDGSERERESWKLSLPMKRKLGFGKGTGLGAEDGDMAVAASRQKARERERGWMWNFLRSG